MDITPNRLHYPDMHSIPIYALYGEADSRRTEHWLHWESIQSRSRLHDYRIAPHRHEQFFQVLRLTAGTAQVTLDGTEISLSAPAIVVVPALVVHAYSFSPDVDGIVVTLMERDLRAVEFPLPDAAVIEGDSPELETALDHLIDESERFGAGHDIAMQARLALLLVALGRAVGQPAGLGERGDPAYRHAQAFALLVDRQFRTTRSIADYASRLGISTKHLNRVCRLVFERSALDVIEGRVALEARRLLQFSTLAIKEIGLELGYEDPAYFTRVLTRLLGQPPGRYRETARSGTIVESTVPA